MRRIITYEDLVSHLREQGAGLEGRHYLLIDEVQEIEQWERAVTSYLKAGNWDIYLTGSNAHMLSSELATLLSGRYVEIPVYPLSLPEFLQFNRKEVSEGESMFPLYLRYGGFPAIPQFVQSEDTVYQFIHSLYDSIILKDIVNRHEIRNVPLFQNISRYDFDNIGNTFSAKKVADSQPSQNVYPNFNTPCGMAVFQVCYLLASEETMRRQFGALEALPDHYPKTVLSMDPIGPGMRALTLG